MRFYWFFCSYLRIGFMSNWSVDPSFLNQRQGIFCKICQWWIVWEDSPSFWPIFCVDLHPACTKEVDIWSWYLTLSTSRYYWDSETISFQTILWIRQSSSRVLAATKSAIFQWACWLYWFLDLHRFYVLVPVLSGNSILPLEFFQYSP